MDGSHHNWFEGRRPKCVLMAYIDDATNRVYGRFYEYEGTMPAMDSFKRYIRRYGIPMSIYFDRHTTYKSPSEPSIEDEINGAEALSESGRALKEFNVELIHAYSPQAKGRVERLFATLQDRLVKELRLKGLSAIEEANKFLDGSYWSAFNKKFMVQAQGKEDLHRIIPKGLNLDKILCIRTERTVRNDNTITHKGKLYQIEEQVRAGKIIIIIEQHINGKMRLTYDGNSLKFKEIEVRPEKQQKQKTRPKRRKPNIPSAAHPWKKFNIRGFMKRHELQKNVTEAAA